jgi:hypothetical protein
MIRRLEARQTGRKVSVLVVIHRQFQGSGTTGTPRCCPSSQCCVSPKEHPMRVIKYSIVAACLSTLLLGVVVANAILAPMPAKIGAWTTTVTVN